jgi:hypothetical protein
MKRFKFIGQGIFIAQENNKGDKNFKPPEMHWHHSSLDITRSTFD